MITNSQKILAINTGSTSTKIAIYNGELEVYKKNVEHSTEELAKYKVTAEQSFLRKKEIETFLEEIKFDLKELKIIVARGGALPPIKAGAYQINKNMIYFLKNRPRADHAANIAAVIAYEMANQLGIQAIIYDAPSVDELTDIARISGLPEIPRPSLGHMLNGRAMAMKYALSKKKQYSDLTLIVAHLGGGISVGIHEKGSIIDLLSDEEGPLSPERAGRVPCVELVNLCYSGKYNHREAQKLIRGKGGLVAYLGTNSALEVEKRISEGDQYAKLIYQAMAYQVAKGIGEMSTAVQGCVDAIIITGGIAHSKMMTSWIKERIDFIAPVVIMPGENELEALALGALRVLRGEEKAKEFPLF